MQLLILTRYWEADLGQSWPCVMVNELRSEPAGAQNMKLVASRGSRSYQQALPPLRQRYAGKLETKRNSASNSTETGLLDLTAPPARGTIREIPFIATN